MSKSLWLILLPVLSCAAISFTLSNRGAAQIASPATVAAAANLAAAQTITIPDGGFEAAQNWKIADAMSTFSNEQVASGTTSLKVVDNSETLGSDVTAARVSIARGGQYKLRGKVFPVSGEGLGIYVRVLDQTGKLMGQGDDFQRGAPTSPLGKWSDFSLDVQAEDDARFLEVWIHSYAKAKVVAYLDDFSFFYEGQGATQPPWPGTYKIKPHETTKLTAADVVGPDGIVYPDWRYAGIPGGIPNVKTAALLEEFGGKANDQVDDSAALERGAEEIGKRGGGALLLNEGTYILHRPIIIRRDNVVIRGAGDTKTKIEFRYARPQGGVDFFQPAPNSVVTPTTWIEVHADPKDLRSIQIEANGKNIASTNYTIHWGGTFSLRVGGDKVLGAAPQGPVTLKAIAGYADGKKLEKVISITTDPNIKDDTARVPSQIGAIMFAGSSRYGQQIKLMQDGRRGARELLLEGAAGLKKGDRILLRAPATPRWNALVRNACKWGDYRRNEFLVEGVTGNKVLLNQPMRLDFPIIDGSYIQQIFPIRRCGVENLALEQTQELWTSGIVFTNAWECWARGVSVKKAGRFPLYCLPAKWCEIRDCKFDDAWYKGGGGTAYIGWEQAYDCLMDGVETSKLRHAPLVQWTASGNVIRNGIFHDSDGQWHSGWTNENLFENCVIDSKVGNGSYGYGLWGSPPEDEAHGPNGPRNVVYNCDIQSPKTGLWMGGMNENWLILHNRFRVGSGTAVFAKDASFDHIIAGNTFVMQDTSKPAITLAKRDCIGVEVRDNTVYGGNGKLSSGAKLLLEQNNRLLPLSNAPTADVARSQPKVPSIFEWQRQRKAR